MRRRALAGLVLAALAVPGVARAQGPAYLRLDGAAPGELAGQSVAGAGDVNSDGQPDLIVGAPYARGGLGAAYVRFGPLAPGTQDLAAPGPQGVVITGFARGSLTGWSVAAAGDVNGDGLADVVVGAPSDSPGDEGPAIRAGRAYIVFGSRTAADVDLAHLGSRGISIIGHRERFPDALGWSVAGAGDVDHDGRDDVILAAPGNPGFEDEHTVGAAYVVFGRRSVATIYVGRLGAGRFAIRGASGGGLVSVSGAGDFDGDGFDDVIAGDEEAAGRGIATIVYGGHAHTPVTLRSPGRRGIMLRGRPRSDTGAAVAGAGDVNGDGRDDVIVGAPQGHRPGIAASGGAWVVFGARSRRAIDLGSLGRRGIELVGAHQSWAGFAVAGAGRVNADGLDDVALTMRGSLGVVFGRRTPGTLALGRLAPPAGMVIDGHVVPNEELTAPDAGGFTALGALGDGRLLAGARLADHNGRINSGSAYLFLPQAANVTRLTR